MLNVGKLNEGVVLDHIPAGKAMDIYKRLKLSKLDCQVAMIMHARSSKMGMKDIIKVDAAIDVNLDIIGYVDPGATVNVIRDGELKEKKQMGLPEKLVNVLFCKNPRCITSCEQELDQVFCLTDKAKKEYRCLYCETKASNL
jgi:aspartate carbamoyltransferase regulatory subunit